MKDRISDPEFRFKVLKVLAFLLVILLFWEEISYFLGVIWNYVSTRPPAVPEPVDIGTVGRYLRNMILGVLTYFIFLQIFAFFFAQFLLPVQTSSERRTIFQLFSRFLSGGHGPLIFIRDGKMISHYGEEEKEGPGVLLVNSNSAVVVGGKVHGPGIVFKDEKQKINAVYDLRKQVRSASDVRAVTRDGIEVETNVSVQFSISAPQEVIYLTLIDGAIHEVEFDSISKEITKLSPDDFEYDEQLEINRTIQNLKDQDVEGLPFADLERYEITRYISDRIQQVFDNQPRQPSDGKKIDWRDLPLTIAIEEFRNIMVRYPYDELFLQPFPEDEFIFEEILDEPADEQLEIIQKLEDFTINKIRREFSRRVCSTGYLAYHYIERIDHRDLKIGDKTSDKNVVIHKPVNLQFPRPLRQSMITISSVGFGEIVPSSPEVKRQTIENLIARWNSEAYRTGVGYEEQASLIRGRAMAQVQQETVTALAEFLKNSSRSRAALILRIFQGLEAATDGSSNQDLVSLVNMLGDMREWFLQMDDYEEGDFRAVDEGTFVDGEEDEQI